MKISTIAVCAESGASILNNTKADLLLTGEMSYHEVLDVFHKGSSVILLLLVILYYVNIQILKEDF